ncbi:formate dehydrogenase accessory sulfurtransferase FdhD [Georgenia sp. MJ206]|uniref:formate dehydrogenase accessory sulfurtransferase FdhD n=1 Tax=Georgenia wangjunii TaxID=3117730 RepID=UPI002F2619B6
MTRVTKRWPVRRMTAAGTVQRVDVLAGEEPLEIGLHGTPFTVTMRTPGHDFDLVAGFLVSEGVVRAPEDIVRMDYRTGIGADGLRDFNVVDVRLAAGVALPSPAAQRNVYTSSSCGVCGTASIEGVRKVSAFAVEPHRGVVRLDHLLALPERLRERQELFGRTGGVHAAGLFVPGADDGTPPALACLREDVGRHNCVDKVVGWALREGMLPAAGAVLQVSGRASFELVQKAAMAGIPVLSAVSAPSALAVELAEEAGLTLVAFNRGTQLNAYTHAHRIRPA